MHLCLIFDIRHIQGHPRQCDEPIIVLFPSPHLPPHAVLSYAKASYLTTR